MKLGKYETFNHQDTQRVFSEYVNYLQMPLIDYVAIGVQNTINKTSTSLMSRPDWQKFFKTMDIAEHDPIRKAAFNTHAKIFSFEDVDHQNTYGREVMRQRRLHGIENGIVIMKRELGHNFMLTLATG
jgi:hypothetical protein